MSGLAATRSRELLTLDAGAHDPWIISCSRTITLANGGDLQHLYLLWYADIMIGSATAHELGARIRQRRERLGLSQTQVADAAHVSRQLVSRIEHGHYRAELGGVMAVIQALGGQLVLGDAPARTTAADDFFGEP